MARKQGGPPPTQNRRPASVPAKAAVLAGPVAKTATPDTPKKGVGPIGWIVGLPKFASEVRAEARKITWTPRRETWITSVMVFVMVVITAVFFLIVDQVMGAGMHLLLNLAA